MSETHESMRHDSEVRGMIIVMLIAEFETIDEGGFIFKIRKSRLEELEAAAQLPSGVKEGELPDVDSEPVAEDQSSEDDKKRKRLLALKAM